MSCQFEEAFVASPVRKTEEKERRPAERQSQHELNLARLHSRRAAVFGRPCSWGGGHSKGASWQQWGLGPRVQV